MFIEAVRPDDATGDLAEIYRSEEERWGWLPGFTQAFSHHPEAYRAWLGLITVAYSSMDRRRCELATLAAAKALRSTCCTVAHGKFLQDGWYESDQVKRIATDHHDAGLDDVDVAIMDFAEKAATDPAGITQDDVEVLRGTDCRIGRSSRWCTPSRLEHSSPRSSRRSGCGLRNRSRPASIRNCSKPSRSVALRPVRDADARKRAANRYRDLSTHIGVRRLSLLLRFRRVKSPQSPP